MGKRDIGSKYWTRFGRSGKGTDKMFLVDEIGMSGTRIGKKIKGKFKPNKNWPFRQIYDKKPGKMATRMG